MTLAQETPTSDTLGVLRRTSGRAATLESAVIGVGAVGLALASALLAAGERVRLVARGKAARRHLEAHGIERTGLFGDVRIGRERIVADDAVDSLRGARLDFLLVCTKSTAAHEVAAELAGIWPSLLGRPRVVLFQNGWGNAERLAERLPAKRIFSARVITGFRRRAPHAVEVTVHADPIRIGSLFGVDLDGLAPLCEAIARGGLPCEPSPTIARELWAKMLYNCALNPLGALLDVPYGVLAETTYTRELMDAVVREVFDVMRAAGYTTHWSSASAYLEVFYRELLPATKTHESSMLQDLRAGRATEVDSLCGAVVELAAKHRIPTPVNAALCALVHAGELRSRGPA